MNTVAQIVAEREEMHDYKLSTLDHDFLVNTMTDLIFESVNKFIQGGAQHNPEHESDFITACDHDTELNNEVIDFIMYSRARKFRNSIAK